MVLVYWFSGFRVFGLVHLTQKLFTFSRGSENGQPRVEPCVLLPHPFSAIYYGQCANGHVGTNVDPR